MFDDPYKQYFGVLFNMITQNIWHAHTSRRASAYELMSVIMTRTCFSHWYAMNSAVVSAMRGVIIRSILHTQAQITKCTQIAKQHQRLRKKLFFYFILALWFNSHPSGCIWPHVDTILFCLSPVLWLLPCSECPRPSNLV